MSSHWVLSGKTVGQHEQPLGAVGKLETLQFGVVKEQQSWPEYHHVEQTNKP